MIVALKYLLERLGSSPIRLGTRDSILALWQANHVKGILESQGLQVEIIKIKTKGDKILNSPLAAIGGKGLFTKELEDSLLSREIDLAVHSLKDVPVDISSGLCLVAISAREDSRDCYVSLNHPRFSDLPIGAKIGTTSLRRGMQLKRLRPDLDSLSLRGNVQTRLDRLARGDFQAIVLALAGLRRLGLVDSKFFISPFELDDMVPAMGQGALGIECREAGGSLDSRDWAIREILHALLHNEEAAFCCELERYFIKLLGGSCQSPIGVHVRFIESNSLQISCIAGNLTASKILKKQVFCHKSEANKTIVSIVEELMDEGLESILHEVLSGLPSAQG